MSALCLSSSPQAPPRAPLERRQRQQHLDLSRSVLQSSLTLAAPSSPTSAYCDGEISPSFDASFASSMLVLFLFSPFVVCWLTTRPLCPAGPSRWTISSMRQLTSLEQQQEQQEPCLRPRQSTWTFPRRHSPRPRRRPRTERRAGLLLHAITTRRPSRSCDSSFKRRRCRD